MNSEQRDNDLEKLFRTMLEENEAEVDAGLTQRFMGRLGRREFFRFNLSRFNVWYLTAAVAAVMVGMVLLLGGGGREVTDSLTQQPADEKVTVAAAGIQEMAGERQAGDPAGEGSPDELSAREYAVRERSAERLSADGAATGESPAGKSPAGDRPAGKSPAGDRTAGGLSAGRVSAGEPSAEGSSTVGQSVITAGGAFRSGREGEIGAGRSDSGSPVPKRRTVAEEVTGSELSAHLRILSPEASVTSGCLPLHVSFTSNSEPGSRVEWNFGDGGTSSLPDPEYIYDLPGRYNVVVTSADSRGRRASASIMIEVWERPVAAFEVQQGSLSAEGGRVQFINRSAGAVEYLWDFGDGTWSIMDDPSYRYPSSGTYEVKLVAWSAEGCADSVTVSDLFSDGGMFIRFPNAFAPGSDGPTGGYYNARSNEESRVFHPAASGIASYNLKVYSKAGVLLFESSEPEMGWDGYYKGRLCTPGVYVWKVRGRYRNGETFIMAGDVMLLSY